MSVLVGSQASAQENTRVVASGLEFPAGIAFLPDDRMLVTERVGRVRVVEGNRLLAEPLATFATTTAGETGVLGIAVPPDFKSDPAAYVFVTEPDGSSNSIWRVPIDGSAPTRVIEGIPAAGIHNGGGLVFGRDGMLYVSNGEQGDPERASDPQVLGGKVYRFARDGSVPDDGPFDGVPVFAYGLRNPFGIAVDPETGDVWVTENGPSEFDELNHVPRGSNLGWPETSGPGCNDSCIDPVLAYRSIVVPTGITFAPSDIDSEVAGDLFFATYGEGSIHRVRLDPQRDEAVADEIVVRDDAIVPLAWGPDGLYYGTSDSVKVVRFAAGDEHTPTPEAAPTVPESRATSAPGSDADDGGLSPLAVVIALALLGSVTLMRARLNRQTEEAAEPGPQGR